MSQEVGMQYSSDLPQGGFDASRCVYRSMSVLIVGYYYKLYFSGIYFRREKAKRNIQK